MAESRTFIIGLTEGQKTEPHYFRLLAKGRSLAPHKIRAAKSPDPLNMLSELLQWRDAEAKQGKALQTWLILDAETKQQDPTRWRRLQKAVGQTQKYGLQVALSQPSFELWLLLHLEALGSEELEKLAKSAPEQINQRLAKHVGGHYRKSDFPFAEMSEEMLERAMAAESAAVGGVQRLCQVLLDW